MNNEEKILALLEKMDARQTSTEALLEKMDARQTSTEALLEKMDARLAKLETDVSSLKTDVSSLKTDVSSLKTDVSSLKTDVSSLKVGQANADDFISFARDSMFKIQSVQLPEIMTVLESYDGHSERLVNHNRRITKVENLTEDHGNRIWVLEQVARK